MEESNSIFTKIAMYLILVLMLLFFFAIGVRVLTRVVLVEKLSMNNALTRAVMFDNPSLAIPSNGGGNSELKGCITSFSKEHLPYYKNFTELAKAYNDSLDWTIEKYDEETVLTLDDGYHVGTVWKMDVSSYTKNICEFNAFLKENDIPFVYAALPGKISKADKEVSGVIDFSNQNYDTLLDGIRNDGVEVFDLRERMAETFDDHHAQFFITDHHWKPETGLWAAGEVAKYLNERHDFDFELEKFDAEKFDKEVYKDIVLGSRGRKLTLSVAKPESISLLYPRYDVDLTIEIPSQDLNKTGDFDVVYSYEKLERGDFYQTLPYAAYLYGDLPLIRLTNNDCENDKSLLVIGDSMDNSMLPFLSLGVRHITAIDLRPFTDSLQEFIRQHRDEYDMVIVANSVISVIAPPLFDFS